MAKMILNHIVSSNPKNINEISKQLSKKPYVVFNTITKFIAFTKENSIDTAARHYVTTEAKIQSWLNHTDRMDALLGTYSFSPLELLPNREKEMLKELSFEFHSRVKSKAFNERLKTYPTTLKINSILGFIEKIKSLAQSDSKNDHQILINAGFSTRDITKLSNSITTFDKRSLPVKAVADWVNSQPEDTPWHKEHLYKTVLASANAMITRKQVAYVIKVAKRYFNSDPTGLKLTSYLKIPKEKAFKFINTVTSSDKTPKNTDAGQRKRKATSSVSKKPPPTKAAKLTYSQSYSDDFRVNMLRALYKQGVKRKDTLHHMDIKNDEGKLVQCQKRREALSEWNTLAQERDIDAISSQYSIDREEAELFLQGYLAERPSKKLSESEENKNKSLFYQTILDNDGLSNTIAFAAGYFKKEKKVRRKTIEQWTREWKTNANTMAKNAPALASDLDISIELASGLIEYFYKNKLNKIAAYHPSHLKELLCELCLPSHSSASIESSLVKKVAEKFGSTHWLLLKKSQELRKMVFENRSIDDIATRFNIDSASVEHYAKHIQESKRITLEENKRKFELFNRVWSEGAPKASVADVAGELNLPVSSAQRWCSKFRARVNHKNFSVSNTAHSLGITENELESLIKRIKASPIRDLWKTR